MAKILKDYTWSDRGYPWDHWLDGRTWEVDMNDASPRCRNLDSLYMAIYQAAKNRGLRLRTDRKSKPGKLIFQAYDPEE